MSGFPKIRGTFLGIPIMRIIVYWDPLFGNFRTMYSLFLGLRV